ncbi:MAG TPA: hypothetical protein PKI14_12285 [Fervidobacterium sp.]|nr:hypothetical protein [Fervidobacterium sp.]HUM43716.1 hypothetical protein [Fervidobacterium sp.]
MAVDILKLYEEVQNGEGNKRTGITKEIIEETVKVMKILKEKKQVTEIGRSELTAIVTKVLRDKKKDEGFKLEYATLTYAWGSTKAKEAGLAYDDKKKKMVWKK